MAARRRRKAQFVPSILFPLRERCDALLLGLDGDPASKDLRYPKMKLWWVDAWWCSMRSLPGPHHTQLHSSKSSSATGCPASKVLRVIPSGFSDQAGCIPRHGLSSGVRHILFFAFAMFGRWPAGLSAATARSLGERLSASMVVGACVQCWLYASQRQALKRHQRRVVVVGYCYCG